jgi:tape measure domain-containing protein
MADASKTVQIIFEGDTSSAEVSVGRLNNALTAVLEEEKRLTAASAEASAQIDKVGVESEQSAQQVDKLGDATSKTKDSAELLNTALKVFIASAVTKAFIDANVSAEQFRLTMTQVTGTTEGANQEFEYIRQTADRLGLNIDSASASYARLAASTKNTALEGDGAKVIFEAVAGSMSRLGVSSNEVDAALVQVAQGVSKGRFELEDLKSIAERIPGFFDQFATSLGVSTEELFKLITQGKIGGPEMLKFANSLNAALGTATFDTYTANLNRLQNSVKEAFVTIGDAGAFDIFIKAIQAGTAAVTGAISGFVLLGETVGNILFTISSGDWSGFGARFDESLTKAASSTRTASDALLGLADNTKQAGFDAVAAGQRIATAMEGAGTAAEQTGEQILAAFDKLLKASETSESLAAATTDLIIAYTSGKIPAEAFYSRLDDIQKKQLELDRAMGGATSTMLDQTKALEATDKAAQKAKESAEKYALEMEKLASNERIKLIEAQVKLDIAEVEANAKVAVSAFESVEASIASTGETLASMLNTLAGGTKDWETWRTLTSEIAKESARRDDLINKQIEMLDAQIALWRAQTRAYEKEDALIKVDGAGLQPHLEAFMWEILKAIQVRVNEDGYKFLLGV